MFGWLRKWRRRKILAEPFPDEWRRTLERDAPAYRSLAPDQQSRLRDLVQIFIAEKNWEGCAGLELSDESRVIIAAYACLLILELDPDSYDHVITILVYPDEYRAPHKTVTEEGFEREDLQARLGEAWSEGVVVIAWADLLEWGDRRNVVVHEFAHQLDMLNGVVDGTPPLRDARSVAEWRRVMKAEYERFRRQVEIGRPTFLDPYGATSPAEFFAVASEAFFENPAGMRSEEPMLYRMLSGYYRQDPAPREER
ncbi:MAG: zinc-dependent peptidase [Planctomycetota bacterium]